MKNTVETKSPGKGVFTSWCGKSWNQWKLILENIKTWLIPFTVLVTNLTSLHYLDINHLANFSTKGILRFHDTFQQHRQIIPQSTVGPFLLCMWNVILLCSMDVLQYFILISLQWTNVNPLWPFYCYIIENSNCFPLYIQYNMLYELFSLSILVPFMHFPSLPGGLAHGASLLMWHV